jgi:hypothetical protein
MASARVEDAERTVHLATELVGAPDKQGPVCLLQIGKPSALALQLGQLLTRAGWRISPLVIKDRTHAQSDSALGKLAVASTVWVFADDLLEAFFTVFATELAFALRTKSRQGLPVVGLGGGALALGGLLLANRVCPQSRYELVTGLGWAPRVLLDGGALIEESGPIARTTVRALPGLLGIDLGAAGGVRVEGGRVESIGSEPVLLFGAGNEAGSLLSIELEPGQITTLAPPPFAPFEQGLLPTATLRALSAESGPRRSAPAGVPLRHAPEPTDLPQQVLEPDDHSRPGSARLCPMCKKVHAAEPKLELVA